MREDVMGEGNGKQANECTGKNNKNQEGEKKLFFSKLTPEKNVDISGYKDALDFALRDSDIKNVAISGIYSSGKSSVIETYKDQNENIKFLHISLGYYRSGETSRSKKRKADIVPEKAEELDTATENNWVIEETEDRLLEGKILNQLLHQIEAKKIPQTIFKVKRKFGRKNIIGLCSIIMMSAILLLYLLNYNSWTKYIVNTFNVDIWKETQAVCFALLVASLSFLLYKVITMQLNKNVIKNLSIKGANFESNIEVFKESTESYFDKYLNDVIYLFDNCEADVIVFEDIDRFENSSIFQKLKEINTLVNNRIGSDKKLTFLYLLRDDMFLSKDRTKFFDFIIPIIPVMDASNSYEKFKEILENQTIFHMFDENFLQKLSLYIDDMRLVKNIINEFVIYHNKVNTINLNANKLLALISYKNIFPKDFSELQLNRGFMFNLFQKRKIFIDNRESELAENILKLENEIKIIKNEQLNSISELEAMYLTRELRVDNKSIEEFDSRVELIIAMKHPNARISHLSRGAVYTTTAEAELELIHQKSSFMERKKNLEIKEQGDSKVLEDLEAQISILREEMANLILTKVEDVITEYDIKTTVFENTIGEIESFDYIKRNEYYPLIFFLLRNGFIDKDYSDYMTYFYTNSISISDKLYLRSITDESPLEWNYPIINKRKVVDRLSEDDLRRTESLNIDISSFLIKNNEDYKKQVALLFNLLSSQKKSEYIVELYKQFNTNLKLNLVCLCFEYWRNSFSLIINNDEVSRVDKEYILKTVLEILTQDEIRQVNESNFINKFLESSKTFLALLEDMDKQLVDNLNSIDLKFIYVDFAELKDTWGKIIYENNLYKINFHNIKSILEYFYHVDVDSVNHKNYTLIRSSTSSLEKYVESNINSYMGKYLEFSKEKILDDKIYVYIILNNEVIDLEKRKEYISYLKTNNLNLSEIESLELKEIVITSDLATPDEENLFHYFIQKDEKWSIELISFANKNKDILEFDYSKISSSYSDEECTRFFGKTVRCFDLENEIYEKILVAMKYYYTDGFSIPDIPQDKMQILIETRLVRMTEQSLASLRELYKMNIVKLFIKQNIDEYLDIISDMYDYDELIDVLKIEDLTTEQKMKVVDIIDETISVIGQNYSEDIIGYILENKFDDSDFETLINQYSNYNDSIKNIICEIAGGGVGAIIDNECDVDKHLLDRLLSDTDIPVEKRTIIFIRNIKKYTLPELKLGFEKLGLESYLLLLEGRRPTFEINDTNESILKYLKEIKAITSFKKEKGLFRGYGKKTKK